MSRPAGASALEPAGVTTDAPIAALLAADVRIISCDIFDTILLRDSSTETVRFEEASRRAAVRLGVDGEVLARLRWLAHDNAYRAIAIEGGTGEARLGAICEAALAPFGLGTAAAQLLRDTELLVDASHLRPHRAVLDAVAEATKRGSRVIAVSDTYYSSADVESLLRVVAGVQPFDAIYTSADLGSTKHNGGIYSAVAGLEGSPAGGFIHIGDLLDVDVTNARAAGWRAVHLPRHGLHRAAKLVGRIRSLPAAARRIR